MDEVDYLILSKSRYMSGRQCLKRLFLDYHHKDLATAVDAATQARFDEGHRIGELAQKLRPGGMLIEQDHHHPDEAIVATKIAIEDANVAAIYEAAFRFEDVLIRVDILARAESGGFELMEVKSSTKVKPEHKPDLGIQLWVLESLGIEIDKACLVHINRDYVYPGDEYDVENLFTIRDLTDTTRSSVGKYSLSLDEMRATLRQTDPPAIEIGSHCNNPNSCCFLQHCRSSLPNNSVHDLYRVTAKLRKELRQAGVETIPEIPLNQFSLSDIQERMVYCVRTGQPFVSNDLTDRLRDWGRPLHFLDFETIGPGLPIFPGTRPYQSVPFQWSVHTLHADGSLEHHEYLHEGSDDPRAELAAQLVKTLQNGGRVVHYTGYEISVVDGLIESLPQMAEQLENMKGRFVDVANEIRKRYYHPAMNGSFSLKAVYPALFPGESFDDVSISDGTSASVAYLEMLDAKTSADQRLKIRQDLIDYCRLDTEATVKIYQKLTGDI